MDWDDPITNIVGKPETGNKNFTASTGALGSEKGVTMKLRVSTDTVTKDEDLKSKWKGTISYTYKDNDEGGSANCTFDVKKDGYYIFDIVKA